MTAKPRGNSPAHAIPSHGFNPQTTLAAGFPTEMSGQQTMAYGQAPGDAGGGFNLSELTDALPQHFNQHDEVDRSTSGSSTTLHQQSPSPFAGQTPMTTPGYSVYSSQYGTPYQQMTGNTQAYPHPQANQAAQNLGPNPVQAPYSGHTYYPHQQQQPYILYPGPYGLAGQHHPGLPTSYAQSFGRGTHQGFGVGPMSQPIPDVASIPGRVSQYGGFSPSGHLGYGLGSGAMFGRSGPVPGNSGSSASKLTTGPIPSSPRGPPRKPKQSGHALWVGNLPSGTQVIDLKDHFSREATKTIESVFLISKSNCAFVNYRSDEACAAAMTRFHDSRFQGVRLVCRLRRGAPGPASGVPTGPATLVPAIAASQSAIESIRQNREVSSRAEAMALADDNDQCQVSAKGSNKFFIMKSLTVEDIELSIRNSIWATQAHNEEALNKAFETAENVYLIFSANKSGEYFGYARMASPITEEVAASLDWAPKPGAVVDDPELPRAIPTQATEWAPRGRIIDDSARGTIFWEADPEDSDLGTLVDVEVQKAEEANPTDVAEEHDEPTAQSGAQAFGKPFKIEWLATNRLPFYRTRGLRNPWNANREVKIARDGTELEPSVGRRLIQMFHGIPPELGQQTGWPQQY
ncbi:MAG: hypothetical protein L6R38_002277 [Xanthoria sp. 2 TBL-2021]|nr:MAG: hypothetical protein L6R38_002277 [Xanthoria sp. 2 TBL-2021]